MTATNQEVTNATSVPHGDLVLVTGATGYVGARLVPILLEAGYRVRVMVRAPRRLQGRPWHDDVEIVEGDVLQPPTLPAAVSGVRAAYYLIHSMSGHDDFHERDLQAARNFGRAAREAGVEQIIYLSGLGNEEDDLSPHLRSRQLTGAALRQSNVAVTELRAAIIVGSGSISFEMVRSLTERLPVMIIPRWAATRVQPIAVGDVLNYLLAALEKPQSKNEIVEIGGRDVLTYAEMMRQYARERDLRRFLIPVPVLTPRLSSYWVHWTTPIPSHIARHLIEGLRNEVVVSDDKARRLFPHVKPVDYQTAVGRALQRLRDGNLESVWSDALSSSQGSKTPSAFKEEQGMFMERHEVMVAAPAADVYRTFSSLGGKRGWLIYNWAWLLRGILDRLVGGVGFRRGRRDPDEVRVGDALDFWRVEAVEPGRMVRLRAEMKLPGRAWLQFEADPLPGKRTRLVQTAYYAPKGLFGRFYWYVLVPVHGLIFPGMARAIAATAAGKAPPSANSKERIQFALILLLASGLLLWLVVKTLNNIRSSQATSP